MEPLVSIITVAYNSENTIKDTIESVLDQTYKNIEYIIIDGASKDKTLEIVKRYKKKFNERGIIYKYISEKDNGIYDAMNKGIDLARGDIIGLLNSDDWYEKNGIEIIVDEMNKKCLDFIYADINIVTPKKKFVKKARLSNWVTSRYWNHPTTFLKKDVYSKYKYKCESIHDDLDLLLKLRKDKEIKVGVLNKVVANFRFGGVSNKKSLKNMIWNIKNKNRIYKENGYSSLYFIENTLMEVAKYILG